MEPPSSLNKKKQFISSEYGGQNKLGMHTHTFARNCACTAAFLLFEQLSDKILINMRTKFVSFLYEQIYFHFQWLQFLSRERLCVCEKCMYCVWSFFETCVRTFYQRHGEAFFCARVACNYWFDIFIE